MRRLFAAISGLTLLAQVLGLQLICLCGACPVSRAWGGEAQPEHACCRAAAEKAAKKSQVEAKAHPTAATVAGRDCGCADHALHNLDADLSRSHRILPPAPIVATASISPLADFTRPDLDLPVALSRGPPDVHGPPLFIKNASLLI